MKVPLDTKHRKIIDTGDRFNPLSLLEGERCQHTHPIPIQFLCHFTGKNMADSL